MAKTSSKPRRKPAARRAKARPTTTVGKRPLRRSGKSRPAARGKEAGRKRSPGKLAPRGALRAKKRATPKPAGRTVVKAKVASQTRDKSKLVNRKPSAKPLPKVPAKPAPKLAKPIGKVSKPQPVAGRAGAAARKPMKKSMMP